MPDRLDFDSARRVLEEIAPTDTWDEATLRAATGSSVQLDAEDVTVSTLRRRPRRPRRPMVRTIVGVAAVVALLALVGALTLLDDDQAVDTEPVAPPVTSVIPDATAPVTNGWVAFDADGSSSIDIYVVRPGEDARRIEVAGSDTADEACPAWSPDGTRLLFSRLTGSSSDAELVIVPVGLDGAAGAPTVIALDGFDVLDGYSPYPCGVWAPDGRWVAFAGTGEVWVVDTQTSAILRLPDLRPIDLEWRPGTDQLAIAGDMGSTRSAGWHSTPVTVYSVSTDELHQLGSVEAGNLTWSPDGATLGYQEVDGGLWLVDADGANERLLVADPGNANHGIGPVWSPTGDRIVYQRVIGCCERHEVVLVSVADGNQTVIEPPETGEAQWYPWTVTWSPDGTTLLYNAWTSAPEHDGMIAVPADTPSDVTILTNLNRGGDGKTHQWVRIQTWGRQSG